MRLVFVAALAILGIPVHAAPVAAEEGTFTACLTKNGQLNQGAAGLEPQRDCRKNEQEIHLKTGEVIRFNLEIVHDPESVIPTGTGPFIETDEFAVQPQCDATPLLVGFFDEDVIISVEAREVPSDVTERQDIDIEPGGTGEEVFLTGPGFELVWFEAYFTPVENPTYIALLRFFATGDVENFRCQFRGEAHTIELPELEVVE
jgi:hypothetical protein